MGLCLRSVLDLQGFGCDMFPYYGFGYGGYNLASQPNYSQALPPLYDLESQVSEDSSGNKPK